MFDKDHRLTAEAKKHLNSEQVGFVEDFTLHSTISTTPDKVHIAKFNAAMQMYAANLVQDSIQSLISSNERIAVSNERHSQSMNRLTMALVFVGVVQIIIQVVQISLRPS